MEPERIMFDGWCVSLWKYITAFGTSGNIQNEPFARVIMTNQKLPIVKHRILRKKNSISLMVCLD